MRILFWNGPFLPRVGGVEIFTARLAAGLIARGHQVEVLADGPAGVDPEIVPGLKVRRLPLLQALNPANPDVRARLRMVAETTSAAAALKRAFRPDLIHINLTDAGPFFHLRTVDAWPAPVIMTVQSALERRATPESVTGSLVAKAQALVAVSHVAAANAAEFTGRPVSSIEVIQPGVPAEEFGRRPVRHREGEALFGYIGRLVEEKGVQVILRALARLPRGRLRVIGGGVHRPALEALASELGVAGRVEFMGEVSDAERPVLMAACDALVVPSQHVELFGMVAVEGGLVGLPVIASRKGGLQEIVVHGETGFLFPPGDDAALAMHMKTIDGDDALARRMGAAGRARALKHFTVGDTVERYEALYRAVAREWAQSRVPA